MAVPNTTTFSFQDVCTEIYGYSAAGMSLATAITDATGTFDPRYVGSKNSLLCFRNYRHGSSSALPAVSEVSFPNGAGETTMDVQTTVSENGGGEILEMGVVFSTLNNTPTTADSKVTITPAAGQSMIYVTGLTPNTLYYWRTFATNANGTTYYPNLGFEYATTLYQ